MIDFKRITGILAGLLIFSHIGFSQFMVTFTDGEEWNADGYIEECINSFEGTEIENDIDKKGVCECMITKMAKTFSVKEFTEIIAVYTVGLSEENKWFKAKDFYSNPSVMEITQECFSEYVDQSSDQKLKITSENEKQALIQYMKDIMEAQEGIEEFKEYCDIDKYCECLVEGLLKEFSISEMFDIDPENVKLINIQTKCALKSRIPE